MSLLDDVFGLTLDLFRFRLGLLDDVFGLLAGVLNLLLGILPRLIEGLLQGFFDLPVVVDLLFELLHLFLQTAAIAFQFLPLLGDHVEKRLDLLRGVPAKAPIKLLLPNLKGRELHGCGWSGMGQHAARRRCMAGGP